MVTCTKQGGYYFPGSGFVPDTPEHGAKLAKLAGGVPDRQAARRDTMSWHILQDHNRSGSPEQMGLTFDALASPDNNYVSILQTVRAVGVEQFPAPYILTNCHNTLCCVGGTINADDHAMGLDCARRYGGIYLPPYAAVIHQYIREAVAGCGKLVLASDSHTRYGALGCMGIGEGGGELAKQIIGKPYELAYPPVVGVRLTGAPRPGVGPMDVALALIGATFPGGFVKNKVLEFVGEGLHGLSVEYRMGIDVMTTESAALSSVWETDGLVEDYLALHGRAGDYKELRPASGAYYDSFIELDLDKVPSMIALPFHPSNAHPIAQFMDNAPALLKQAEQQANELLKEGDAPLDLQGKLRDGGFYVQQALVSGCAGGLYENIVAMADILKGYTIPGDGLGLGINPASQPINMALMEQGIAAELMAAGAVMRPAVCGPCFGVSDIPANGWLSARHVTRNFMSREGSRPVGGQMAAVALMDARTVAATVRNGGRLTGADALEVEYRMPRYTFDASLYERQVYNGFGKAQKEVEPHMGPNIRDWPKMAPLPRHLLLQVAGRYNDPVGTDDLLPSGEASSYRSNPYKLAEFTMAGRDRGYYGRAKAAGKAAACYRDGEPPDDPAWRFALEQAGRLLALEAPGELELGSVLLATQIGDGSSREQAASCQRILGGRANLAEGYATKRYRSNLVNWGMLPFTCEKLPGMKHGDFLLVRDIRGAVEQGGQAVDAFLIQSGVSGIPFLLSLPALDPAERETLLAGGVINAYSGVR